MNIFKPPTTHTKETLARRKSQADWNADYAKATWTTEAGVQYQLRYMCDTDLFDILRLLINQAIRRAAFGLYQNKIQRNRFARSRELDANNYLDPIYVRALNEYRSRGLPLETVANYYFQVKDKKVRTLLAFLDKN